MKIIYLFSLFFLLSCNTVSKDYVCGDHACIDKKEFNKFFSENLIVEIKIKQAKKDKKVNLVEFNTKTFDKKKINKTNKKNEEKFRIKNEKKQLKATKKKLLKMRKIKEAEEKKIAKALKSNKRNQNSLDNKNNKNRKVIKNAVDKNSAYKKNNKKVAINKEIAISEVKTKTTNSICDRIKDCDIDKIAEILIKNGREKPFPSITSN